MSYNDKVLARKPPAEPWDSGKSVSPAPWLPFEEQLVWYKAATHVLMLNVSEQCRRAAAAEADRELDRKRIAFLPLTRPSSPLARSTATARPRAHGPAAHDRPSPHPAGDRR